MLKWENLQPVNVRQKDNRTGCCRNHSNISGAFVWPQLPISCSTGCLPNYLGGVRAARTSLCILYILCTCYLADIAFPPSPRAKFLFRLKKDREENVFELGVWKATEGDLDLGRRRSAVIRQKKTKKTKQKTPTQVHMALPFPLPSCANLDMITSEKSRGGSGFTAEMEDTISVCFCARILLHASVWERE